MGSRRSGNTGGYLGLFAMIAVILMGLALLVRYFWAGGANVMHNVAFIIATIIVIVASFNRAIAEWRRGGRSGIVWFVLWVIAVVLIVVFYILSNPFA